MSKTKDKSRPKFECSKCRAMWVSLDVYCIACGSRGIAMNDGAKKLLKKLEEKDENQSNL